MNDTDNNQTQMRKGLLEFAILLVIATGPVYTSDIILALSAAGLHVAEGTLYPLMARLKKDALVEYTWVESASGPPRKYYILSGSGKHYLADLQQQWNNISSAIEHLTHVK